MRRLRVVDPAAPPAQPAQPIVPRAVVPRVPADLQNLSGYKISYSEYTTLVLPAVPVAAPRAVRPLSPGLP